MTEERERFVERLVEAAEEAERQTGSHEVTEEEVRRGLVLRIVRMVVGFVLITLGLAALPLPGPGWLIILLGLSLLPFAWAERTITLIRRRIPGVPESGRIPTHTWVIMGAILLAVTAASVAWGDDIATWAKDTWSGWTG